MKRSDAEYALATCLTYFHEIRRTGQVGCPYDLADRIRLLDDLLERPTDNHLAGILHDYDGPHAITKHKRT
jgi:hypothetical protein